MNFLVCICELRVNFSLKLLTLDLWICRVLVIISRRFWFNILFSLDFIEFWFGILFTDVVFLFLRCWWRCIYPHVLAKQVALISKTNVHSLRSFNWEKRIFELITQSGRNMYVVNLKQKSCTCCKWEVFEYPYSHVLSVCNKLSLNSWQYAGKYYSIVKYWSQSFFKKLLPNLELLHNKKGNSRSTYEIKIVSKVVTIEKIYIWAKINKDKLNIFFRLVYWCDFISFFYIEWVIKLSYSECFFFLFF